MADQDPPAIEEKIYTGQRPADDDAGDCRVYVTSSRGTIPLRHINHHSPTGFEWGYGGSGPADLALAILADHFGDRPNRADLREGRFRAWAYHQGFKWAIVARLPHREWRLTTADILDWIATQPTPDIGPPDLP